jgi:mRNA interferase RelE/StbE
VTGAGYAIYRTREADKQILRLDKPIRTRVVAAIGALAEEPRPAGCEPVKTQPGAHRVRVGPVRIVYEVDDQAREITVIWVGYRGEAYRKR